MQITDPADNWQPETMPSLLIARAAHMLARIADARFREIGLGIGQIPVFVALKDGSRLSQKELTRRAGVEQPSMAQLLVRMERDGLICREPDPADGRSTLISLTQKALDRLGPGRVILAQGNGEALEGFDEAEIEKLAGMLRRVIGNLSTSGCEAGGADLASRKVRGERKPEELSSP